ncbi:MAG: ABC transporter ATP-binding protein [Pyrinomonadaceae bacterium]
MAIIKFENVTKSYGDGGQVFALNNVDLEIESGERVAIMGPSGSGKSTLLNLICGLDRPSSGSVVFDDRNLAGLNDDDLTRLRREKIGMIFQTFNLLPILNALENVALPLRLQGIDSRESDERAAAMLRLVGLTERTNNRPDEMSGGERQRVAIARALIFGPLVLLADEPTGNLDSHTGDEVLSLMDDLHNEFNTTIVLVTHNEHAAMRCERRITLLDGQIEKDERREAATR